MTKHRGEYTYKVRFGTPYHQWSVIGAKAGVHLHIMDHGEKYVREHGGERYSGGIEIRYRYPPEYMQDDPPSQDECWLLKCPCWQDGSSLQASEFWIPRWLADPHNHDGMLDLLAGELEKRDVGFPRLVRELAK